METNFTCTFCGVDFQNMNKLQAHISGHHANGSKRNKNSNGHGSFEHPWEDNHNRGEFPSWCKFCGNCFNSYRKLKEHSAREHSSNNEAWRPTANNRRYGNKPFKSQFQSQSDTWQIPLHNRFDAFSHPKNV